MLLSHPLPPRLDRALLHARRADWLARAESAGRLLDARRFVDFCARRGVDGLHENNVLRLWQEGLLRADLVLAQGDPGAGFEPVPGRAGWYTDARLPPDLADAWDELLAETPLPERGVLPLFHPHRFPLMVALMQMLEVPVPGAIRLYSLERLAELAARASGPRPCDGLADAWESLQSWCELAVALVQREGEDEGILELVQSIGEPALRAIHARLCEAAMALDDNRDVHTLLRFLDAHRRAGISGPLGACLQLLEMAERIRRAAESALAVELPEEDEAGSGALLDGAKKKIYGSTRLLDDDRSAKSLVRLLQLEGGLKVRCYAEGAPEHGALCAALRHVPGVAIVDLRAQLVDAERRDAAFAESLRADISQRVYSYVLLDGRREDSLWVVTRAAEQEELFGGFRVSAPDLEFENFGAAELAEVLWSLIRASEDMRAFCEDARFAFEDLLARVEKCSSAGELFRRLEAVPELDLRRNERWGEALMQFATRHPNRADGSERPLVAIAREVVHATRVPYTCSWDRLRVDPTTGRLIERQQ
jgi:hypothetical protein